LTTLFSFLIILFCFTISLDSAIPKGSAITMKANIRTFVLFKIYFKENINMTIQQKYSTALNIALWIAQVVLAASFIWAGMMKLFQPIEKLSEMWLWTSQVPDVLLKFTGIVDLLGGIGLILPSLLRIKPKITPMTAIAIVVLMVCASIFHIVRGEASQIGANIVFVLIAAFIAWGRRSKVPITAKY
jgi:uncharacterized membrane protein YphA (DoxX/SURF4 family)